MKLLREYLCKLKIRIDASTHNVVSISCQHKQLEIFSSWVLLEGFLSVKSWEIFAIRTIYDFLWFNIFQLLKQFQEIFAIRVSFPTLQLAKSRSCVNPSQTLGIDSLSVWKYERHALRKELKRKQIVKCNKPSHCFRTKLNSFIDVFGKMWKSKNHERRVNK